MLKYSYGIVHTDIPDLTKEEADAYIDMVKEKLGKSFDDVKAIQVFDVGDGNVDIKYLVYETKKFERIRRITGYLTGTVDRWNNDKRAELNDRVKHA